MSQVIHSSPAVPSPEALAPEGGYVSDIVFRTGVVTDQMPVTLNYVALLMGYVPRVPTAALAGRDFAYLDLGCGEGTTLLALASLYPRARFTGVDFNADHVREARAAAVALALDNVTFIESSFLALDSLALGAFDYITCNGIYGWLDPESQAAVDAFVGAHLAPQGLFYVEYLSMPGKAPVAALWHFIQTLTPPSAEQGSRERAEQALQLLERLSRRGLDFLARNPAALMAARNYLGGSKREDYRIDHFAHNALAEHFRPRYFTEIHDQLTRQGLAFVGRSRLPLNDLELAVPPMQVPTFLDVREVAQRELLKDFIRNEHDRQDIWVLQGEADEAKARAQFGADFAILPRTTRDKLVRKVSAPGGHALGLMGPGYERLIERSMQAPCRPEEMSEFQTAPQRVMKSFNRLVASGQFFLVTRPSEVDMTASCTLDERDMLCLNMPFNVWQLRRNAERLQDTQLVAEACDGVALRLSVLETRLCECWTRLPAGQVVAAAVQALIALGDRQIPVGDVYKPARSVTKADIDPVWEELRQVRLPNLLRLGMGRVAVAG